MNRHPERPHFYRTKYFGNGSETDAVFLRPVLPPEPSNHNKPEIILIMKPNQASPDKWQAPYPFRK